MQKPHTTPFHLNDKGCYGRPKPSVYGVPTGMRASLLCNMCHEIFKRYLLDMNMPWSMFAPRCSGLLGVFGPRDPETNPGRTPRMTP